jgi:hypothetical protein
MGGPRRRSKKPSPCLVFIPVIERNQGQRRELCPEVCPIGYAQTEVRSDDANHTRSCI